MFRLTTTTNRTYKFWFTEEELDEFIEDLKSDYLQGPSGLNVLYSVVHPTLFYTKLTFIVFEDYDVTVEERWKKDLDWSPEHPTKTLYIWVVAPKAQKVRYTYYKDVFEKKEIVDEIKDFVVETFISVDA